METETLSNYKSTINMHLLQETVDKTLKNGTGLHEENNCDISDESGNDNVCLENENKDRKDAEWTSECNVSEKNSIDKKEDSFDSDVEEEEHVPLNIETTSDIEKSDDDLDESKEQSTTYDSDKDESSKKDNPKYDLSDPLERDASNGLKETKQSECLTKLDTTLDNSLPELNETEEPFKENESLDSGGTSVVSIKEPTDLSENEKINSNESGISSDLNDKDTNNDELDDPSGIECEESSINDKALEQSEIDKKEDANEPEEKEKNVESPQKFEGEKDIEHNSDNKLPNENKSENIIDEIAVEKKVEGKSEENITEELAVEKKVEGKSEENITEELTVEKREEGKSQENISGELAVEKKVEGKSEDTDRLADDTNEKTNENVMEREIEKKSKSNTESCPLLMQTLTKKSSKEYESEEENRDDEMDEAYFDPSLLCPDISMEVDEDPVITTNDAPPPPQDGNKSPLLYEPIFSTFVDEMTGAEVSLNLSLEEEAIRQETYGDKNPVQLTKVHCTACNVHLGSALDGQGNRFVHPLLKVLICKNCYHFYTSGEFEKDEDGSELYCRWCGQGGQVMCCSNCEMVFCKKCIRINFDRKKLAEIRDSDDWLCFRCNPSQLTIQRIHCAEFMEYVRREISRAATLDNATTFMTTDYSQCCTPQKKKATDAPTGEPKKKKRKIPTDPDYDPFKDREETESPQPSTSAALNPPAKPGAVQKPPNIVSYVQNQADLNKSVDTAQPSSISNSSSFKIGATTFSPRTPNFNQSRPKYQVLTPVSNNAGQRPKISGPGYIKILPGGIRIPGNAPTPRNISYSPRQPTSGTTQSSTLSSLASAVQQRQNPSNQPRPQLARNAQLTSPSMKHEWFEKTVRAAARVNSNLSYTLTQLNRAQANAQSVEALAVVHNKLQEILSTSINSLIQIRKNLRTEFIAGIKNIRFPPAAAKSSPSTVIPTPKTSVSTDDDVIFISPPTSPVPPPLTQKPTASAVTAVNLPASVSLIRKPSNTPSSTPQSTTKANTVTTTPISASSSDSSTERPKTFLRVKSLTALQNVPSECITIPDDPLPPPPPLTPLQKVENSDVSQKSEVIEINSENADVVEILDDNKEDGDKNNQENTLVNDTTEQKPTNLNSEQQFTYNLQEPYSKELNKIMSDIKIVLEKSSAIDKMVKLKFNESNNDVSD